MKFNKWVLLTIEYMMQQEENLGASMQNITSQTQCTTTFDDLQINKEEKITPMSLGTLSYSQLQQESRPLSSLLQRVLSIITIDYSNCSKQNTNIPEEREDEFEDDSLEDEEEDDNSEEYEEEIQNDSSSRVEKEEELRVASKSTRQSQELEGQNQQIIEQQEQQCKDFSIEYREKEMEQKELQQDQLQNQQESGKGQENHEQNLNTQLDKEHIMNGKELEKSRTNSNSSVVSQLILDQQQDQRLSNKIFNSSSCQVNTTTNANISKQSFQEKRCSFDIGTQEGTLSGDFIKTKHKIKRKSKNTTQSEQCEDGSNISIQTREKSKKSIQSGVDVEATGGYNEEECYKSSKSIKRRNDDKNNLNIDSSEHKSRHYNHHNRKQNRINHNAKIDEDMEYMIVEEVQKVCLVLKDKQLIQWDKNELLNIVIKFKYFQELSEIFEQNDIDGFVLFIIINDELQLHDLPRLLNISFSSASKIKSFIQILEPIRQEQMIKIAKKKKYVKLTHQSSIEGDFVIESPELKSKNNNYQQSNRMSFQQVPTISQMGTSQKPSFSAFYGGNSLKTSSKFNTYDQLQDSSEYEEQKMQGSNNRTLKNNFAAQQAVSSQMTFEIQTREKLLSSTSDHDTQNQNFKASTDQSKVPFMISQDKPQSNNTIYCNDSQSNWNSQKIKSPNQIRLIRAAFNSQLTASQNRTSLGLSSHFTSANNTQNFDEKRNINSQPTLGTSFHFDRQSTGISVQTTTPKTIKLPDEDTCVNSAITTAVTAGIDSKGESGLQQTHHHNHIHNQYNLKNQQLYPSKSTYIPQNLNNNQDSQYISSESQLETPTPLINDNSNIRRFSAQIQSTGEIADNEEMLVNQQTIQQKNAQESSLGDSSYISQPLGISQKVEKQLFQGNNGLEIDNPPPLRKVSSNNTLFQSMDQQQPSQLISSNLVNSQQLSNSQPQSEFQNQQAFFTQSDNFDQSIKLKGITKGQSQENSLKFQVSQQKQQNNSLKVIKSNQSINNITSPVIQSQNHPSQYGSYSELNQLDLQQQNKSTKQYSVQQNTPSFYPAMMNQQSNSRTSLNNGTNCSLLNLNQQFSQKSMNRVSFDNQNDVYQLKFQPEQILGDTTNSQNAFQNSQKYIYQQSPSNQQQNLEEFNKQVLENEKQTLKTNEQNQLQNKQEANYSIEGSLSNIPPQNNANQSFSKQGSYPQLQQQLQQQQQQQPQSQLQQKQQQESGNNLQYAYGNSIPPISFPQRISQDQQQQISQFQNNRFTLNIPNNNFSNFPQDIQSQQYQSKQDQQQLQQMDPLPDNFLIGNNIQSHQQGTNQNNIDQNQQQIPYQQGSSFICYSNMNFQTQSYQNNPNLPLQQPQQFQNHIQGNSVNFQQYPPQQSYIQQVQQEQSFQGNQLPFLQNPQQNFNQCQNDINNNQVYNQGASIYYNTGQYMFQPEQNQQNIGQQMYQTNQQSNYGSSYIGTNNQINPQQNFPNYNNYYNPNQQQLAQQHIDPTQIFNYNHHIQDQSQMQAAPYDTNNYYYNNNNQQYYQNQYSQNDGQQYHQENQGNSSSNIGLKLPNIFLMNIGTNTNDELLLNSQDVLNQMNQVSSSENQLGHNNSSNNSYESMAKNLQNQKMQKLLAKQNQVIKCTYNLPFNPFKFDVIPTIKVDIKSKNSDQHLMYYTFHSEGATIGRNISNSINFLEEQTISAFHAIIFFQKRDFYIQDIKSKAGTFIKIKNTPITNNLKLKLGEVEIKIIKMEDGVITLQTSSTTNKKVTINMNQKSEYILGRCRLRCDIQLSDVGNTVSYLHAKIHFNEKKEICITDLDSGNGTWLRLSEKSCRSNPYKISVNDQIMISNTKKIVIIELNQ